MQFQTETVTPSIRHESRKQDVDFKRYFTTTGQAVFDTVEWETRDAVIRDAKGVAIFEQKGVEFPKSWSQLATNVTVEKYFRGRLGSPERETSLRQVIARVASTISTWGVAQGYFSEEVGKGIFQEELAYILLHQKASFNSPVWFNLGIIEHEPQVSACFIQSVKDDMESIMDLAKSEVMLFKGGSGTGSNLSAIRSSKEHLKGGGLASGPVSFMKGYDAFAGVTKSGGRTRRAAKMVILNVDHPDIVQFIRCKSEEEKKAHALIDSGWDGGWNVPGGAYDSIQYQNANNSVRLTDEFMRALESDELWQTKFVTSGGVCDTYKARDLMRMIAEAAHFCGDPGLQFDTTINDWNTCSNTGRINGSNPCAEYVHLDDSACNLASINLRKFERAPNGEGWFDAKAFENVVRTMIIAQDIIVGPAGYPTEAIGKGARAFRQLGLGFANLGGLLMSRGIAYDSDTGRSLAAGITDLMQATSYKTSAELAEVAGPFEGFAKNRKPMLRVVQKHIDAHEETAPRKPSFTFGADPTAIHESYTLKVMHELSNHASLAWKDCAELGEKHGYRNSQVTVLAPTGTISFMMDCDTTGIEPELALTKFKSLAGGGSLTLINGVVPDALANLGYSETEIAAVADFVKQHGRVEGCDVIKPEHMAVFDCSFRAQGGTRVIKALGHIRMMAAVQPFLSGAISKTVNVDNDTTVEQIEKLYIEAWGLGLKAVAVYRDGCKRTQPLSTKKAVAVEAKPSRRRLADEREAVCHKFSIAGHEGYLHVGMYGDGTLGELFIRMAKEGSTISGMMDAFATAISIGLQYGVPISTFVEKFKHTRFEPSGITNNGDIRIAQSIIDYIFRWLEQRFLITEPVVVATSVPVTSTLPAQQYTFVNQLDAPICTNCGNVTVRNASCYKCLTCGSSNGCS